MSALQRHTISMAPDAKRNLRLNTRYFGKYGQRDFSKTTTEGEYAQGLCFLFAQDVLKVPALVDFDHFCDEMMFPRINANASKPDFVGSEKARGYWLVEAKGNLDSSSVKTELRKGVAQCGLGADHLMLHGLAAPEKSYTTLISFRNHHSNMPSRLCYVDPQFPDDGPPFDTLQFLRSYYENIIVTLGFSGDTTDIWTDPDAAFFRGVFETSGVVYYRIADDGDPFPPVSSSFFVKQLFYMSGVSKEVILALASEDVERYYALIPRFSEQLNRSNRNLQEMNDDEFSTWQGEEFFIDGTMVHCEIDTSWFEKQMEWFLPSIHSSQFRRG